MNLETLARRRFKQVEELLQRRERVARETADTQREVERLCDRLATVRQASQDVERRVSR